MFVYQTPSSSFKRLLVNDRSKQFTIHIMKKCSNYSYGTILIDKTQEIFINTTINKARMISKAINVQYSNDQTISQYDFDINKLETKIGRKVKLNEIIEIFDIIINHYDENIANQDGNEHELLDAVLHILDDSLIIYIDFTDGNKLNGIISYIKRQRNESVEVSGGGNQNQMFPIENITEYDNDNIHKVYLNYCDHEPTKDKSDAWIEFDFVKHKVNVTSYSIRSSEHCTNGNCHPKSWRIVGSNDHINWEHIDIKKNRSEINGPSLCHHFECERKNDHYYRYIKYIQLNSWIDSCWYKFAVCITCFEFFGSIE